MGRTAGGVGSSFCLGGGSHDQDIRVCHVKCEILYLYSKRDNCWPTDDCQIEEVRPQISNLLIYTDWKHTSGPMNRSSELECSPYHRLNHWSVPSLHQSIICPVHKIHLSFFLDFPSRWPFWDHMVLSGLSWDDIIMRWSLIIEASWSGTGITQPNWSVPPLFLSNLIPSDPLSCYFICVSQHHKLNTFCFY